MPLECASGEERDKVREQPPTLPTPFRAPCVSEGAQGLLCYLFGVLLVAAKRGECESWMFSWRMGCKHEIGGLAMDNRSVGCGMQIRNPVEQSSGQAVPDQKLLTPESCTQAPVGTHTHAHMCAQCGCQAEHRVKVTRQQHRQ